MADRHAARSTDDPWLPTIWQVVGSREESWDTTTITIRPRLQTESAADAMPAMPQPGQFNMLYAFGVGEIAISYSAIDEDSISHTVRRVGPVSNALSRLQPGSLLGVRGPFGTSWCDADHAGREILVIAGGVGLAPLKPLVEAIGRRREQYSRVHVLYGARDQHNLIFAPEIDAWRQTFDIRITVDTADQSWHGDVGVVMKLLDRIELDASNATAFVCGPEVMMRFTIEKLKKLDIDPGQILLSMERNMKCAIGFCGHCQFGGDFICRDGPVFRYPHVAGRLPVVAL
jgi:NAD(P)H-flavin reductase